MRRAEDRDLNGADPYRPRPEYRSEGKQNTSTMTPERPKRKRSAASMALSTLLMVIGLTLSKGTGFLRETFIGLKFGYGTYADAFYLGFQIPDLFFQLLIGGSIQAAITPTLARSIERGEERKGWRSASIFITLMSLVMLTVTLLGSILSEWLFPIVYSGKSEAVVKLAAQSSKALFPQVFFMMLAALCIGVLNAYKKFSSTAFGPTLYNICVVLAIVVLGGKANKYVVSASVGITVSAAVYFVLQFFMARQELRSFRPSLELRDEGFRELLKLAVPTMLSASIVQLNTIIITGFTGAFDDGIVQSLNQARTIWQIPYGIFAVAVGSVMLPSLAANYAVGDFKSARALLGNSLRNALFLTIPSAGLLFSLSSDVVQALFKWSSDYDMRSCRTTAAILMGYGIAIIAQTVVFIYNQAFYAIGRTKVPLLTGVVSMALIAVLCKLFLLLDMGALGLSMAYSMTSTVTAVILVLLYRKNRNLSPRRTIPFAVRCLICTAVLLLVVYTLGVLPVNPETKAAELGWLAVRAGAGLGGYLVAARALQMRELNSFAGRFLKRKRS